MGSTDPSTETPISDKGKGSSPGLVRSAFAHLPVFRSVLRLAKRGHTTGLKYAIELSRRCGCTCSGRRGYLTHGAPGGETFEAREDGFGRLNARAGADFNPPSRCN
jgi:hypothetical protein